MCGVPLTAEQRPLFFKHPVRVAKADLSDDRHAELVEFEAGRAKKHEQQW